MLKDDIELGEDLDTSTDDNSWGIDLDLSSDETTEIENTDTDSDTDPAKEDIVDELLAEVEKDTDTTPPADEVVPDEKDEPATEETPDDILNNLLEDMSKSKEEAAKLDKNWADSAQVGALNDSLKKMEDQLKKLTNEKTDLTIRNAELETFWSDSTDPKILILSKHLEKAKAGDDRSKEKVSTLMKEMLYELTGEDFDQNRINSTIDTLSASEAYNTKTNPNLNIQDKEEELWISI